MPFPPTFDHVWDLTAPSDTQLASQGAADFRSLKDDVMQRMSLLSGTLANRPTPETVNATWGGVGFGLLYFSTDNRKIYQWSGAGPAWVDISSSFLSLVASVDLLAQAANIPLTTLYAVPASAGGFYRATAFSVVTRQSGGSTIPNSTLSWTEPDVPSVQSLIMTNAGSGAVLGTQAFPGAGSQVAVNVQGGTNIQYGTNGYVAGGGGLQYSLHIRLEFLGG